MKEIEADAKQFGDDRRTLIQEDKKAVAEVKVVDEPVTVVVSRRAGCGRARATATTPRARLQGRRRAVRHLRCRTIDTLLVFGSNGRVYIVAVSGLPGGRGDGQPITSLIDLETGTQPRTTAPGRRHRPAAGQHRRLRPAGQGVRHGVAPARRQELPEPGGRERLLPPAAVGRATQVACLSMGGRLLVFPLDELKLQANGGRGLTLMDVDAQDPLVSVAAVTRGLKVLGIGRGGKPKEEDLGARRWPSMPASAHAAARRSMQRSSRNCSSPCSRGTSADQALRLLRSRFALAFTRLLTGRGPDWYCVRRGSPLAG